MENIIRNSLPLDGLRLVEERVRVGVFLRIDR
jgi:hypothetical protein